MAAKIEKIAVHQNPHLDEIAAIWLLRRFGQHQYEGIGEAEIVFWTTGATPDGQPASEWQRRGVIAVGIGRGKYDEHADCPSDRVQSCFSLVAEDLGVAGDPALQHILEYVTRTDAEAGNPLRDALALVSDALKTADRRVADDQRTQYLRIFTRLAELLDKANRQAGNILWTVQQLIKDGYQYLPKDPTLVMDWATFALDVRYEQQARFLKLAEVYARDAEEEIVLGPRGRSVLLVTLVTENEEVVKYARSERRPACIIRKNPVTGNVQIFPYKPSGISMRDLARAIRAEELAVRGVSSSLRFKDLEADGELAEVPQWFFHNGGNLLNGSLSHPRVEHTAISLARIKQLVKIVLDVSYFDPAFEDGCRAGRCDSREAHECPLHCLGLQRCRQIRYEQAQKRQPAAKPGGSDAKVSGSNSGSRNLRGGLGTGGGFDQLLPGGTT